MKKHQLPRLKTITLLLAGSLLASSCTNLFWTAEQTVKPLTRGSTAFPRQVGVNQANGTWSTTLHSETGDTLKHSWKSGLLTFEKSHFNVYLVVRNGETLISCYRFRFQNRKGLWYINTETKKKVPRAEQYAYTPVGTAVALVYLNTVINQQPSNPWGERKIYPAAAAVALDLGTGIWGEVRAKKDPRLKKGLVQIYRVTPTEYPTFLKESPKSDSYIKSGDDPIE